MNFLDCLYYRAKIKKENVVIFTYLLKSLEDHLCFDRTEEKDKSIFEFFVPNSMNERFLEIINILKNENLVEDLTLKNIEESSLLNYKK